ncbi:ER lumen protein retaining receptor [Pancytospora philotis]|nr:ER lumen protein retaining receptor [Pancytospora philotis]
MFAPQAARCFRFLGDALIVGSRAVVVKKVHSTASVSGISLKTQVLYLCVYALRYLDLLNGVNLRSPMSIYNSVMKVIFLAYQAYIIYLIASRYKSTHSRRFDSFNLPFVFLIAAAISVFVKGETYGVWNYLEEYAYTVSLVLEAVAILPQLVLVQEAGDCESLTAYYISMLGLYRLCYFVFAMLMHRPGKPYDLLFVFTSLVQTGLYIDFFAGYYRHALDSMRFSKQSLVGLFKQ